MIRLKTLSFKNFLSVGACIQTINFDNQELTLILGENLDLGGLENRNGVGKTTMIQALSYALFGNPINDIRKDNLINRTNGKNMHVTLEFSSGGIEYRVERGRKPNVLKFFVNAHLQDSTSDAQGENKETQLQIDKAIGMSCDMFTHIVALNTYTQPFLSMKAADQRNIIEQLLGITLLSEKAEKLKVNAKELKDKIQLEEFKVKAVEEANKRVQEQIDSLVRRQHLWKTKHEQDLHTLAYDYEVLSKIDIDSELLNHKELALYNERLKKHELYNSIVSKQQAWSTKLKSEIASLEKSYDLLSHIDIQEELQLHKHLAEYKVKERELTDIKRIISSLELSYKTESATVSKLEKELSLLEDHKCYACGQAIHDETHDQVLSQKQDMYNIALASLTQIQNDLEKNKNLLFDLGKAPVTYYKTEAEAYKHSSELENIKTMISSKKSEVDPYSEQLSEIVLDDLGDKPDTHYDTEQEAIEHRSRVQSLLDQIEKKYVETDPYTDQITDMKKQALQQISFDEINKLTKSHDHVKFLIDLLTNKDSFVRKKIIDQSLAYLNSRLSFYLDKVGLPHNVVFKNDLTVEITDLGRELDFDNLSRGESNRVILSLSWAFRDVWENLYQPINVMFIDELLDNGTDPAGAENSLAVLKDMSRTRHKSVWLISHKEELISRVSNVLKVVKENGYTSYLTAEETP